MLGQRRPNKQCEFVDVGGGHNARLLLRRTMIGAQSVVNVIFLYSPTLTRRLTPTVAVGDSEGTTSTKDNEAAAK